MSDSNIRLSWLLFPSFVWGEAHSLRLWKPLLYAIPMSDFLPGSSALCSLTWLLSKIDSTRILSGAKRRAASDVPGGIKPLSCIHVISFRRDYEQPSRKKTSCRPPSWLQRYPPHQPTLTAHCHVCVPLPAAVYTNSDLATPSCPAVTPFSCHSPSPDLPRPICTCSHFYHQPIPIQFFARLSIVLPL